MKSMKLVAVLAILAIAGAVIAAEGTATSKPKFDGVRGMIVKVDGANVTIKGRADKETVVVTDANTVVTIDEKASTVADLKADMYVQVTPATGTATKIVASTKKPEHPAGSGEPKHKKVD